MTPKGGDGAFAGWGLKVVSFCHYLQGPACSQYLADMGADVIKVEPISGAFERHWSGGNSYVNGVSMFSLAVNRNKRSIALNLKDERGKAIALDLVRRADVLVENYRTGVMDRLGLGFETVKSINPRIVYASASGLGRDGPDASRPGQDLLMQARSGLAAVTGGGDCAPVAVGAAIVDQHGGALLAMGILAAYINMLRTGLGTRVESNLFSAAIDLQVEALTKYFAAPNRRGRLKRGRNVGSWYHDAPYGVYRLQDASIALSMNDPNNLADALDSAELRSLSGLDRYEHREKYATAVAAILEKMQFADVAGVFNAHKIWFQRIQDYEDLLQDQQALHNSVFEEIDVKGTRTTLITHPLRYDGKVPKTRTMPLDPGSDSIAILDELGYSKDDQESLIREKVVGVPASRPEGSKPRSSTTGPS
ncbi:MAG: CaiB/BaiF CoA transferase family protein [Parvibaculaceae bacterium]